MTAWGCMGQRSADLVAVAHHSWSFFSHLYFEHCQPSMTLFKFKMSSARLRIWRPGLTAEAQWDLPNWTKPKKIPKALNTYLHGWFPLLGFWSCLGLSPLKAGISHWFQVSEVQNDGFIGVQFADGITEKLPRARGHKMSYFISIQKYSVLMCLWSRCFMVVGHVWLWNC